MRNFSYQCIVLAAIISLIIVSFSTPLADAAEKPLATLFIDDNGVVYVNITYYLEPGQNIIPLPTKPIILSIETLVNGTKVAELYDYETNSLIVPAEKPSTCIVRYIANVSVTENAFFSLNLSSRYRYRLALSPSIVLLSIPKNITFFNMQGNIMIIEFDESTDFMLTYVVKALTTITSTSPSTQAQPITPSTPVPLTVIVGVIIVVIVVAVIAVLIVQIRRVRRGKETPEILDEVDIEILKSLERRGGSALQSEIQKDLPTIPRTTLWRHVKRLERLGYVRIEKVGNQNKVILVKKPR
ncbi:MAG: hypothetical protein JHC33_07395 [Ignisphaera sp.]|nr:hypothetical protein [Ignisphaera sp.]